MGVLPLCCAVPVCKVSHASVAVKCGWVVLKLPLEVALFVVVVNCDIKLLCANH